MKPLAQRHEDRAQRKADNMAESTVNDTGTKGNIGRVANLISETQAALSGLSAGERRELQDTYGESLEATAEGFRSIAEEGNDADGLALAGIGTFNAAVVPMQTGLDRSGTPALNGELPPPSFDPAKGNLNGQAVDAAGATAETQRGWGASAGHFAGDGYGALSLNELKAEADGRDPKVAYPAKVKDDQDGKDGIIASLRADDQRRKNEADQGGDNS